MIEVLMVNKFSSAYSCVDLPIEIWVEIFKYIRTKQLIRLQRVNKLFEHIIKNCVLINNRLDLSTLYSKDLIISIINNYRLRYVLLPSTVNDDIIKCLFKVNSVEIDEGGLYTDAYFLTDADKNISDESGKYLSKTETLQISGYNVTENFFSHLSNIKELYLTDINIRHIPNYKTLTTLSLDSCHNIDDNSLKLLTALTDLKLFHSKITGESFRCMCNLKKLFLWHCSHIKEKNIKLLTSLVGLYIRNSSYMKGTFLRHLLNIEDLDYCNPMWARQYIGDFNDSESNIKPLSHLNKLSISNWGNDSLMEKVYNLDKLELYNCLNITNVGLNNLCRLTSLNVYKCHNINHRSFYKLSKLTNLRLNLCEKINDKAFRNLSQLTRLTLIDCDNITDHALIKLHKLTELSLIRLDKIRGYFSKHIFNITSIEIDGCKEIEDHAFENFPNLTYLKLKSCDKLTDSLMKYLTVCANLKSLELEDIPDIDGKGFTYLSSLSSMSLTACKIKYKYLDDLPGLKKLKIMGCNYISDNDIIHLRNVTKLYIKSCNNITGKTFWYLKNLRSLKLLECKNIIQSECKYLSHLDRLCIDSCHDITYKTAQYLSKIKRLTICTLIKQDVLNMLSNLTTLSVIKCHEISDD